MAAGRWAEADKEFSGALNLDGGLHAWRRMCLLRMARCQRRAGLHKEARASAELMIKWDDGAAEAHNILAEELMLEEKWEEASRAALRCVCAPRGLAPPRAARTHGTRMHTRHAPSPHTRARPPPRPTPRSAHELDRGNDEYRSTAQRAEAALKQSKSKDYYKILGVPRSADEGTIKRAYRKLALEWHPDKVDEALKEAAAKKFQDIGEAYEVLSTPDTKAKYDRGEDVTGQNPQQGQQHHHGHPFGGGFPGGFPHGQFHFRHG